VTYFFNFAVIKNNIGPMLGGLGLGLFIAVISLFLGIILGLFAAFAAVSSRSVLKKLSSGYTALFRNTPLLVLIFIVYFGLPDAGIVMEKNTAFVFTLSLYAGAYMSDVFRAGLQAIPKGIMEAAQAIGLSRFQIRWSIQMPIMFRNVLPSMSNFLISLFKDTSLAASITVHELTYFARKLSVETFRVFEAWLTAAVLYVVTCYLVAYLLRKVERKLSLG
jgi:His/Glu/Gln/Arg/opine family amino acid ABC transporter permease subunit